MDVPKPHKTPRFSKKVKLTIATTSFVLIILCIQLTTNWGHSVHLTEPEVAIYPIYSGNLDVQVKGFGRLHSKNKLVSTTPTKSIVEKVFLEPGAATNTDSTVVLLSNSDLSHELAQENQELSKLSANLRQLKVNQTRESLEEQSVFEELKMRHETAQLTVKSEKTLAEEGIISKINYAKNVLLEKQLKKQIELTSKKLEQLKIVHKESINIASERIAQQNRKISSIQENIDRLTVKAGIEGTVQEVYVNEGESLSPGEKVALVGSSKLLIAIIEVPQNHANDVELGQAAKINTRKDMLNGTVTRIEPTVMNGAIKVEVELHPPLPTSARPELNVNGFITIGKINNAMYIKRPPGVGDNTSLSAYILPERSQTALLKDIKFGKGSDQHIRIDSHLKLGDKLIIPKNPTNKNIIKLTHD